MSLKISHNSLISRHYLAVDSGGVQYYENAAFGGARRVPFSKIDCILMSPDHMLSLQMGTKVYSIKVDMNNAKHKATVDALLQEVRRSAGAPPQA
jgi:hypothetical protein